MNVERPLHSLCYPEVEEDVLVFAVRSAPEQVENWCYHG